MFSLHIYCLRLLGGIELGLELGGPPKYLELQFPVLYAFLLLKVL